MRSDEGALPQVSDLGMDVTVAELYRIFRIANDRFYGGVLPEPQITVQAARSRSAYGWCTTQRVWTAEYLDPAESLPEGATALPASRYEVNICAEFLNRGPLPAAETLLHEMVHLHNLEQGIRDVSGFQYHNQRFKEAAEAHGLTCEQMGRFGWAATDLQPETALWLMSLNLSPAAFKLARELQRPLVPPGAPPPPSAGGSAGSTRTKMQRWACACTNVRCATELEAVCIRCGQPLQKGARAGGH